MCNSSFAKRGLRGRRPHKKQLYVESKEFKFDSKSVITFIFGFIVDLFMYSTIILKHVLYEIQQTTTAEICVSSTYLMSRSREDEAILVGYFVLVDQ